MVAQTPSSWPSCNVASSTPGSSACSQATATAAARPVSMRFVQGASVSAHPARYASVAASARSGTSGLLPPARRAVTAAGERPAHAERVPGLVAVPLIRLAGPLDLEVDRQASALAQVRADGHAQQLPAGQRR